MFSKIAHRIREILTEGDLWGGYLLLPHLKEALLTTLISDFDLSNIEKVN